MYRNLDGLDVPDTVNVSQYGEILRGNWKADSGIESLEEILDFEPEISELETGDSYRFGREYRNGSVKIRYMQPELDWKRPEIEFMSDREDTETLKYYVEETMNP